MTLGRQGEWRKGGSELFCVAPYEDIPRPKMGQGTGGAGQSIITTGHYYNANAQRDCNMSANILQRAIREDNIV